MASVCCWFRNDLRVHDNVILHWAASKGLSILPVYIFDRRFVIPGSKRGQFVLEAVEDLKQNLKRRGLDLLVLNGKPEDHLPKLLAPGSMVVTQRETTSDEHKVETRIVERGLKLEKLWGSTLYHIDDLKFAYARLPEPFTAFRNSVENKSRVRPCLPEQNYRQAETEGMSMNVTDWSAPYETLEGDCRFDGGETAALARVKHYLWDSDAVATYKETRNGQVGADYSTKLAPWLAAGCISPRMIYAEIKKYESQRVENKSTYWVIFELMWRDFFKFLTLKHGNSIFFEGGTVGRKPKWTGGEREFNAWKEGKTGRPLVDANMRELAATGFMSNRGRQNVASYLINELSVDWRKGAEWFEEQLLDYDVAANWGNWVAAAGLTGGRLNRFNVQKQGHDYDAEGVHVRRWIPELQNVPNKFIHSPWNHVDNTVYPRALDGAGGGGGGGGQHPRSAPNTNYKRTEPPAQNRGGYPQQNSRQLAENVDSTNSSGPPRQKRWKKNT